MQIKIRRCLRLRRRLAACLERYRGSFNAAVDGRLLLLFCAYPAWLPFLPFVYPVRFVPLLPVPCPRPVTDCRRFISLIVSLSSYLFTVFFTFCRRSQNTAGLFILADLSGLTDLTDLSDLTGLTDLSDLTGLAPPAAACPRAAYQNASAILPQPPGRFLPPAPD